MEVPSNFSKERKTVCIQGLGFVGAAMSVAVANAKTKDGQAVFNVIGIDIPNESGIDKAEQINKGIFPYETVDSNLKQALQKAGSEGNIWATTDKEYFALADIVVVDINLDIEYDESENPLLNMKPFKAAIETLATRIKPGTLIVVETTVPPGTCEHIVFPIVKQCFEERNLNESDILIAHSYERVMPGKDYFNSIVNFWRVYSGINDASAEACEDFLKKVISTEEYPLTRLKSTTATETAKVLENSYRATTIAFIEEWGRFAEAVGVDLYEVIDAIRMRPTHSNMRQPGFGVGGYCLTKDPYFAMLAAKDIYQMPNLQFPFSTNAVKVNNRMPLVSLDKIKEYFGGNISGKKVLLLGISYRQDVGDTRYSPSEIFTRAALKEGALIDGYDPLVKQWIDFEEGQFRLLDKLPTSDIYDIIVLAVAHQEFIHLQFKDWILKKNTLVIDANHVLSNMQCDEIKETGSKLICIGKGEHR